MRSSSINNKTKETKMKRKIVKKDYHRNGICGEGFHVGIIKDDDGSSKLFVHFPNNDKEGYMTKKGAVRTAILDVDLVGKKEISFGVNSWRGDHYHDLIQDELIAREKDDVALLIKADKVRCENARERQESEGW